MTGTDFVNNVILNDRDIDREDKIFDAITGGQRVLFLPHDLFQVEASFTLVLRQSSLRGDDLVVRMEMRLKSQLLFSSNPQHQQNSPNNQRDRAKDDGDQFHFVFCCGCRDRARGARLDDDRISSRAINHASLR